MKARAGSRNWEGASRAFTDQGARDSAECGMRCGHESAGAIPSRAPSEMEGISVHRGWGLGGVLVEEVEGEAVRLLSLAFDGSKEAATDPVVVETLF